MALIKYNNNSLSAVTAASSLPTGAMTLIKEQTASSSSTISFVHGTSDVVLDGTYPIYLFKFINCHPSGNQTDLTFNMSTDSGSNYNVTKTSTTFIATQSESGSSTAFEYNGGFDLAQSTGFQNLCVDTGHDNDESNSGELWLFGLSSTTYVKHFMSRFSSYNGYAVVAYADSFFGAGYGNTTSAVDAIQFKMDSGTIDAGTIKLYGIKDS
jgi:hypothetical protein